MNGDHRLAELVAAADAAYQDVRVHIINNLPAPARIDLTTLDRDQCDALLALERAEAELANYREEMYQPSDMGRRTLVRSRM